MNYSSSIYIKKYLLSILCVCVYFNASAQSTKKYPTDATFKYYYPNGQLKKVFFDNDYLSSRSMSRYYDKICDTINQQQQVILEKTKTGHSSLDRLFYRDSLVELREFDSDGSFKKGHNKYEILLGLKTNKPLGISLRYSVIDSLVSSLVLYEPDSLSYKSYTNKEYYYNSEYKDGISLNGDMRIEFGENQVLRIYFWNKYQIEYILYSYLNELGIWKHIKVYYYEDGQIKGFGNFLRPYFHEGVVYYYHKNNSDFLKVPVLQSEGRYSKSDLNHNKTREVKLNKTGVWKYYSEDNCLIKKEIWEEGELLKTEEF